MISVKSSNLGWINNLRLTALLAVITLHVTAPLLAQYGKVPLSIWLQADIYNALVRFAVPVFVMITGALLLHREYELGDFLKKRLGRILPPFLFWSLIYIGYSWYIDEIVFTNDIWANVKQVLHLLKVGSSYHLWYVYMLIGLYFFIPILSKFVRNATEKEIVYFLVIWLLVMTMSQPYISRFNPAVDLHNFTGYIGYLVLGHYLTFKIIDSKYITGLMLILFMGVLSVIVAVGTYLFYANNSYQTLFYEPLNPAIVLLSSSVFLMGRFSKLHVHATVTKVKNIACSYNFGIYLSHAFVLYLLDEYGISYKLCTPIISIPLTAFICFILSLLLVWLLSKLPFIGKWISGQ